jgi:hypothetical protein
MVITKTSNASRFCHEATETVAMRLSFDFEQLIATWQSGFL